MNLSTDNWLSLLALGFSVLSFAGLAAFYVMRNTSKDEADDAVQTLEDETISPLNNKVIDHDRRIIRIEEQIKAMPSSRDFRSLEIKVGELVGDIKELTVENRALNGLVVRIEKSIGIMNEALLTEARKDR